MSSSFRILRHRSKSLNTDKLDSDDPISITNECYTCTQVGVPIFHSTSCDHANKPHWEASAGSSLVSIRNRPSLINVSNIPSKSVPSLDSWGFLTHIYDPRSKRVQRWNRFFFLARIMALAIDPLFLHALSIGQGGVPCLYMDNEVAAVVALLRTLVDAIHLVHMWLQFRMAYVSRESLAVGRGKLVWDPQSIASHYLRSLKRFWFDAFVILPVPQVVFWLVVPRLIREEAVKAIIMILMFIIVFQLVPKVYHSVLVMRRMAKVTGYIFDTIWWGFAINLVGYLIASHVVGASWYALAMQRVVLCLRQQCNGKTAYNLSCADEVCFQFLSSDGVFCDHCVGNSSANLVSTPLCLDTNGPYNYGIYGGAFPAIFSNSQTFKIVYTFAWGLFSLGTFGNDLEPTSNWFEVFFSLCVVLSGLMLFIFLIGNIQVILEDIMEEKSKMERRSRGMEWWMRRRQLPSLLRQRVRHHERQKWALMGGEDEMELIKDFPEGLRRDIKRFLCLDLIRMVPFFHDLDDLILDNICDRVEPLVFAKNEKIIRQGDIVQRMVFIVQGRVKSSQNLSKEVVATSILKPGGYLGDELLSWSLRRPYIHRLPTSSATFTCMQPTEAFGLDADHLHYVINHFRYKFANERLKRTVRYYSSNWRTWAAVIIQLRWRLYAFRMQQAGNHLMTEEVGGRNHMLRRCVAIFMSIRPHDHIE